MPAPITQSVAGIDLSPRVVAAAATGNPTGATEFVIGTITNPVFSNLTITSGVALGAAFTIALQAAVTTMRIRLRQTSVSGTAVADSTAIAVTGGNATQGFITGFDSGAGVAAYVLTVTLASSAGTSTTEQGEIIGVWV